MPSQIFNPRHAVTLSTLHSDLRNPPPPHNLPKAKSQLLMERGGQLSGVWGVEVAWGFTRLDMDLLRWPEKKKDMDLLLLGDAQKTATVPRLPPAPTPVKKNSI